MTTTADQQANKAWAQRNSDGLGSWGDERMTNRRIQAPPGFTLTDASLPTGTIRLTTPDDATLGRAVVHVHTYSVEEP